MVDEFAKKATGEHLVLGPIKRTDLINRLIKHSEETWMHFEKPWINSPAPEDPQELVEFGGILTQEIVNGLAKRNAMMLNSSGDCSWRIAVSTANLEEVKKFLQNNNVSYIRTAVVK